MGIREGKRAGGAEREEKREAWNNCKWGREHKAREYGLKGIYCLQGRRDSGL